MAQEAKYQPRVVPLSGAIVAVVIAAMAGFVVGKVFSGPPKRRAAASAPAQPRKVAGDVEGKVASQGNPPAKGPADAKAVLVEFSDFECGFCSQVVPTIKDLEKKYGNKLRIVFRHFPLDFHRNAKLAAEASVEAHLQGKFWQYHDKLFANMKALGRADLERYAQETGLDMARFRAALDNRTHSSVVEADMALARSAGVSGTPTFVLNGYQFSGALPVDQFSKMIDDALAGRPVSRPPQRGT
ncbi:MAG: thioredoxin domain-containing protein, partial [Myxococcota bacterium]|nr:thioredoxin domain-containing protein [Myxococcota bacterium]